MDVPSAHWRGVHSAQGQLWVLGTLLHRECHSHQSQCPGWVPEHRGGLCAPAPLWSPLPAAQLMLKALASPLFAAQSGTQEGSGGCEEEPEPVRAPGPRAGAEAPVSLSARPPSLALAGGRHGGDGDLGAAHRDAEQGERGRGGCGTVARGQGLIPSLLIPARTLNGASVLPFREAGTVPTR